MKILFFGGSGQLGFHLQEQARSLRFDFVAPVLSELDICSAKSVLEFTTEIKPDVVVNSAAYTAVDKAEEEPELAFQVNAEGAENVAIAAREAGAKLVHISTDYVFNGVFSAPIAEDARTDPLGVYGESKLEGERRVTEATGGRGLIVRTSSLHGARGHNFVHTMRKLFQDRDELKVVADQIMSPTYAGWLAEVVLDLARLDMEDAFFEEPARNVLHVSGAGACSWFEFACKIYELSKPELEDALGRELKVEILPIPASEYPVPAKRPMYSVLSGERIERILGRKRINWEAGLQAHLEALREMRGEK